MCLPVGSAANTGIAGISRRSNTNGEILVAAPKENPDPKI